MTLDRPREKTVFSNIILGRVIIRVGRYNLVIKGKLYQNSDFRKQSLLSRKVRKVEKRTPKSFDSPRYWYSNVFRQSDLKFMALASKVHRMERIQTLGKSFSLTFQPIKMHGYLWQHQVSLVVTVQHSLDLRSRPGHDPIRSSCIPVDASWQELIGVICI